MSAEICGGDSDEQKSNATPPLEPPGRKEPDTQGAKSEHETHHHWQNWTKPEWVTAISSLVMAITSIALFVTAIVSIKVANLQWKTANKQLLAMEEANKRTDKGMKVAEDNLSLARDALAHSKLTSEAGDKATGESLRLTRESVAEVRRSASAAVASNRISERNVQGSIEASRLDQRGWLGIKGMRIIALEQGKQVTVTVAITNTGKTIARTSKTFLSLAFSPTPVDIPNLAISKERPTPLATPAIMFPGLDFALFVTSNAVASERDLGLIKTKALLIYIFGELEYTDIFGRPHTTLYCSIYEPGQAVFEACPQYNEAN